MSDKASTEQQMNESTAPQTKGDNVERSKTEPVHTQKNQATSVNDTELGQLKNLLLKEEHARLDKLEYKVNAKRHDVKSISEVLAEAFIVRSAKDNMLTSAIEPLVEESVKKTVRKRPKELAAALFPIIGATIRKSISESFSSMLGNLSKSLEMSFSLKGFRWRLEAWRTGKSFSEIVLLNTLVFRVEQIFLIHNETGLVLAHVENSGVESKDADMVSGMLTAIQDFARDCFASGNTDRSLESLRLDERLIYIEQSPHAYLACVIRGTPPVDFSNRLRECLELCVAETADELYSFNGDSKPFEGVKKYLEDCLESKFITDDKPIAPAVKVIPIAMGVLFAAFIVYCLYSNNQKAQAVAAIQNEPGILLYSTKTYFLPRAWQIHCLVDNSATPPETLLKKMGFEPGMFRVFATPYISYSEKMIWKRIIEKIDPPEGVSMSFYRGTLVLSGTAGIWWQNQARLLAATIPGVISTDTSLLVDERVGELKALVNSIEKTVIHFGVGRDVPIAEDTGKLNRVVEQLVELEKIANAMSISVSLTIYGHTDNTGTERRNFELSQERARTIAAKLYANRSNITVSTIGMGAEYADESTAASSRKIEFKVHLSQIPQQLLIDN